MPPCITSWRHSHFLNQAMERLLDVLISTIDLEGINRVVKMNLPHVDGVHYIVSWQMPGEKHLLNIPDDLKREDITVSQIDSRGSSINRNNAINQVVAPYALHSDDDLIYTPEQLLAVIKTFEDNKDVDIACFKYTGFDNKQYPETETDLAILPKNFYPTTFEMAFRTATVKGKLKFNENFGIAAPILNASEDGMYLLEARQMGLNCRFFPITITHHAGASTGFRPITNEGVIMAEGAYIHKFYGLKGIPRLPLFVWRNYKKKRIKFWWGIYYITRGFVLSVTKRV